MEVARWSVVLVPKGFHWLDGDVEFVIDGKTEKLLRFWRVKP
jgi:hypothetical protein